MAESESESTRVGTLWEEEATSTAIRRAHCLFGDVDGVCVRGLMSVCARERAK